jgi:hypothetical protein
VGIIADPKFVALDTASISHAAANPGHNDVKRMLDAFRYGNWIPFLTYHHLEEIAGHQNDEVFEMRLDFLRGLPSIAYLRQPGESPNVGSVLDLRSQEILFLKDNPRATHADVISAVKPLVRSGFSTGREFADENTETWRFFRRHMAEKTRRHKSPPFQIKPVLRGENG